MLMSGEYLDILFTSHLLRFGVLTTVGFSVSQMHPFCRTLVYCASNGNFFPDSFCIRRTTITNTLSKYLFHFDLKLILFSKWNKPARQISVCFSKYETAENGFFYFVSFANFYRRMETFDHFNYSFLGDVRRTSK